MNDLEYFDLLQSSLSIVMKRKIIIWQQLKIDLIVLLKYRITDEIFDKVLKDITNISCVYTYWDKGLLHITSIDFWKKGADI